LTGRRDIAIRLETGPDKEIEMLLALFLEVCIAACGFLVVRHAHQFATEADWIDGGRT